MNIKKFALSLGMLAMTGFSVPATFANTIVVTPTPIITGAGPYTWSYTVDLVGFASINVGDFFTIFDFAGFMAGSQSVNAGWAASSANVGTCNVTEAAILGACALFDDPLIPNLTWTYTGAGIANPNTNPATVTSLGTFSAVSIFNIPTNDGTVSRDNDLQTGTNDEGAFAQTNVPRAAVPEPATLGLLGIALAGLGFARRRRQA